MIATTTLPVILMLEHDDDDRFITSFVFEENRSGAHLEFVNNGQAVFSWLNRRSENNLPLPALILISLYTTPEDGMEILKQLKLDERYKHIPVIMLSGSK